LNWRIQNEIDSILEVSSLSVLEQAWLLTKVLGCSARIYTSLLWSSVCAGLLQKPIIPVDLYRSIRNTQLVGLSGYSKEVQLSYASYNNFFCMLAVFILI